jgi:hypothetical protein
MEFTTGMRIDMSHPITTIKTRTGMGTGTILIGDTTHPTIVIRTRECRTTATQAVRSQESGSRSVSAVGPAAHRLAAARFLRDPLSGQGVFAADDR